MILFMRYRLNKGRLSQGNNWPLVLTFVCLSFFDPTADNDVFHCKYCKGFHTASRNGVSRVIICSNSGTRELTLKCKLKCYFKPMNNPLSVSPSKGKQGTTRGKEKIF